jgi:hypothetical protein
VESSTVTPDLVVRAVLEFSFLVVLFGSLLFFTDFRRRLFALGTGALVAIYVFLFAWSGAQMLDRWQYDYPQAVSIIPLTRFAMYQVQIPESVEKTYTWQAELADGTRREVNIVSEFSAVGLPPMSTRMRVLLENSLEGPEGADYAAAENELRLYAIGLTRALEADGVDVVSLSFEEVEGTPSAPIPTVLFTWDVAELVS